MKNSVLAILLLHRVLYLSLPINGAAIDNYNEALNYCINEGPMEMPPSYGSCYTVGGPKSGKTCKFPFYWSGKNYNGKC